MAFTKQLLTEEFLGDILQKNFQQDVEILNVKITDDVSTAGDSFCSLLRRINVVYLLNIGQKRNVLSLIAKCFPEDEYQIKFVTTMKLFDHELKMYAEMIPLLHTLDYQEKIAPKAYFCSSQPTPVLLLEDLSALNYRVVTRRDGLDLQHCLLVMEKLAYFHAASLSLLQKDPETFSEFNESIFQNSNTSDELISMSYEEIVQVSQRVPDLNKYVDKLKLAKKHILDKMFNIHNVNADFKVLNHGDCWMKNIMFYYNGTGIVSDVAFVDFQLPCFATPFLDLHYFLASSPNLEAKKKHNVILGHYFDCLKESLRKFHISSGMLTREKFDEDFRLFSYCGLGASLLILPLARSNRTADASVKNFMEDDSVTGFRHHCFNHQGYVNEMLHYLPFYDSMGIFDV